MAPRFTDEERFIRNSMKLYWKRPNGNQVRFIVDVFQPRRDRMNKMVVVNNTHGCWIIYKDSPEDPVQLQKKLAKRKYLGFIDVSGGKFLSPWLYDKINIYNVNKKWWEELNGT